MQFCCNNDKNLGMKAHYKYAAAAASACMIYILNIKL